MYGARMETILFEIMEPAAAFERAKATLRSGMADQCARMTFPSIGALARTLTPSRWAVISAMTDAGVISLHEIARRVEADINAVRNDLAALSAAGVIDRTEDGRYLFPFRRVVVHFEIAPRSHPR